MKNLKFISVFVCLIIFYLPERKILGSELIQGLGYSGAHVLFFALIYIVLKIYSFHIENILFTRKHGKYLAFFESSFTLFLSFLLPFFIVRATRAFDQEIKFMVLEKAIVGVVLLWLLFDSDKSLRLQIIRDYEDRISKWDTKYGVFYFGYPPKDKDEMFFNTLLLVFIFIVAVIIGAL